MLHHTRRWNRDHSAELQSAWLNGAGMLVWESVFGSWVGWNARDRSLLRAMVAVQRRYADLLSEGRAHPARGPLGRWPVAIDRRLALQRRRRHAVDAREPHADRRARRGDRPRRAAAPRPASSTSSPGCELARESGVRVGTSPARDRGAARARARAGRRRLRAVPRGAAARRRARRRCAFPVRVAARLPPPEATAASVPAGMAAVDPRPLRARFRRRETGTYGEAPYVEEWKPLAPRLHDELQVARPAPPSRVAIDIVEVSNARVRGVPRTRPATRRAARSGSWHTGAAAGRSRRIATVR